MSVVGALLGSLIKFDTSGIDFAMTALFIVILIDQLRDAPVKLPALIAFISSVLCLLIIGAEQFILPSLFVTVGVLTAMRKTVSAKQEAKEERS